MVLFDSSPSCWSPRCCWPCSRWPQPPTLLRPSDRNPCTPTVPHPTAATQTMLWSRQDRPSSPCTTPGITTAHIRSACGCTGPCPIRKECLALQAQRPGEPAPASAARPLVGLYDSADPTIAMWHVQLAKAAGIDAFLVSWWDKHNGVDQNFKRGILPAAVKEGFKIALFDERAQFHDTLENYQQMLTRALRRYKDSPAYLPLRSPGGYSTWKFWRNGGGTNFTEPPPPKNIK